MADVEVPDWLRALPLAPEYRPTETEFADPIAFISRIEQEASSFGICKVIPPLPKPSRRFVLANLARSLGGPVFTTRSQELGSRRGRGSVHKQVWQSGESYTLDQFEAKARAFARSQLGSNCRDVGPMEIEALFWQAAEEKPIYVEYANDVPGSGFGAPEAPVKGCTYWRRRKRRIGCGRRRKQVDGSVDDRVGDSDCKGSVSTSGKDVERGAGWKLSNSPWNLQVISRTPGSLTRFMPDEIPGVTTPMVYIAMLFSWFAWHVEDHELHSLNFLHMGAPKTWYAVPGSYATKLEEVVRLHGYGGHFDRIAAFAILGEKRTLISPEVFISSGIPCCRLVQNPGEFVVTFPRSYHVGFSHGFNCGEAANFATSKWLNVAEEAAVRRAAMNFLPMLSHQQLLYLLAVSFISRVPRMFLPGVRSSRLKDRQKEERELVVKKAFFQDIMNELKLVKILLGKKSTLRAVLWNTDMLPFLNDGQCVQYQEPTLPSSRHLDCARDHRMDLQFSGDKNSPSYNLNAVLTDNELHEVLKDQEASVDISYAVEGNKSGCSDYVKSSYSDSYANDGIANMDDGKEGDLPYGLDVDSGALACVACGILGYPFMCVIQPSMKGTEAVDWKRECLKLKGCPQGLLSNPNSGCISEEKNTIERHLTSKNELGQGGCIQDDAEYGINCKWNLHDPSMRPRMFCLKHGIQVEEKLKSCGGACLLIICHSDYLKIMSHAMAVDETSLQFDYKDIPMEDASKEDLELINVSIDDEQCVDDQDDWTSIMGLNVKHFVKGRREISSKEEKSDFSMDGVFPESLTSLGSILKWHSKRSRTPYRYTASARSRFQPRPSNKINDTARNLTEDTLGNIQAAESCEHGQNCPTQSICQDADMDEPTISLEANGLGFSDNLEGGNDDRNLCNHTASDPDFVNPAGTVLQSHAAFDLTSGSHGETLAVEGERSCKSECAELNGLHTQSMHGFESPRQPKMETTGISSLENTSDFMMGGLDQLSTSSPMMLYEISQNNNRSSEAGPHKIADGHPHLISTSCEFKQKIEHEESACDDNSAPDYSQSIVSSPFGTSRTSLVIKNTDSLVNVGNEQLHMNSLPVKCYYRRKKKKPQDKAFTMQGNSVNVTSSKVEDSLIISRDDAHFNVNQTSCGKNRGKRKQELDQLACVQYSFGLFARSPCEGLRARNITSAVKCKGQSSSGTDKKAKIQSVTGREKYQCGFERCYMKFVTNEELTLHESNCCTYEGCGKRFSKHIFLTRHQQVHAKERPLQCAWNGCPMTFKWDWARREHFRLHTGERPYVCRTPGCEMTFRYVSAFSKHRRKTGHL